MSSDSGISGLLTGQAVSATDVFPADQIVGTSPVTQKVSAAQLKTFMGGMVSNVTFGSGVPNNSNGSNGDFYFRSDGSAGTFIYHKASGSWTAFA